MKRCPECRRDYYDDTLLYCLEDGVALVQGSVSAAAADSAEPVTAILHETTAPAEALTTAQIHTTEQTAVLPSGTRDVSRSKGFDKRLILIPVALAVIVLGGFFSYRSIAPANQIESIAVMPFVNASGNADVEYLSDGVTESLINNLSQLPNLSVKARSSVFRYKGKDTEPQQVAADLRVQAVLNGRVTQRGDSLIMSLDLVDGVTGNQIWGEQYTRKIGDLAILQGDIARDVSQKLRSRLTGAEEDRVVKNQTKDSEAYQLYLQGRYAWNKRTSATTKKAIEFFQQAIEKDPNYAMAYVGLAESYILSDQRSNELFPKVKAAASKALEIDPTLGEPHAALAIYAESYELDPPAAEKEYRRAIELSPNYATAYHWYGESLVALGRFDEGFAVYKKALELDPFSLAISTDYGLAMHYARQYDQAIDHLKKQLEVDPGYVRTHAYLARVYQTKGMFEEAVHAHAQRALLEGEDPQAIAKGSQSMLDALRTRGPKGYWSQLLKFIKEDLGKGEIVSPVLVASIYAQLGERDEAFGWLEKALHERNGGLFDIKVSPELDNIRDDPRFAQLVKRLNLPE